ncbi:FKBP-type peptidyl-prolyl cis-trans isomerase [Halapricum hydrolyticum]|uniref:Peptidyl-prolyl cis-trans isomerase n=1 Tax=Halapricum hydrolyticum TaxID=2979991 RepID=A0AAE3ICD4_9EURY|nr:peptidylprolyl isomerase [Halapricum hydrolyticum]MCU4718564.1 peptidylprolyl isomerase [Halapricum hydrolyticum]MCU4727587.1 peptidylprolyl isomerase [Halapricum hydrolyticum]
MSIEPGDGVTIEYVGRLDDGTIFDTSRREVAIEAGLAQPGDIEPEEYASLSFTAGEGEIIEGLDEALIGMAEGETATVTAPPEKAYGDHEPDRVREYDPETFEGMVGQPPTVGLHVHAQNGLHGDVTAVNEDSVEVDFNHQLAGETLTFEIEVVEVRG